MNAGTWVAIYLPIFMLLFVILPAAQRQRILAIRNRKRGKHSMTNELLKKYVGSRCVVSTGSFGTSVTGVINIVEDNWIEVTTNKGPRLINADYITNISVTDKK